MKPVIKLWDAVGAGLIVKLPTGVIYSKPDRGFTCLQPSAEGAFKRGDRTT